MNPWAIVERCLYSISVSHSSVIPLFSKLRCFIPHRQCLNDGRVNVLWSPLCRTRVYHRQYLQKKLKCLEGLHRHQTAWIHHTADAWSFRSVSSDQVFYSFTPSNNTWCWRLCVSNSSAGLKALQYIFSSCALKNSLVLANGEIHSNARPAAVTPRSRRHASSGPIRGGLGSWKCLGVMDVTHWGLTCWCHKKMESNCMKTCGNAHDRWTNAYAMVM